MPIIDFAPPAQSWAAYLESLPPGVVPRAQDIYARWDAHTYICRSRPHNGTPAQRDAHIKSSDLPGVCACGNPLNEGPLKSLGEGRAYRAWLAGLMEHEEAQHFYATVVTLHPEQLMYLAIVPALRGLVQWLREVTGETTPALPISVQMEVPSAD